MNTSPTGPNHPNFNTEFELYRSTMEDGSIYIQYPNGGFAIWEEDGYLHNLNGPAMQSMNGVRSYYRHGRRHRVDGPAVVYPDGREEFWIDGRKVDAL